MNDKAVAMIREAIDKDQERWFQKFEVVPGLWTNGDSDMAILGARAEIPADFTGLSVLDVGTNDGFMAFEAERRGAAKVVATDHPTSWGNGPFSGPGVNQHCRFDLVHAARLSRVIVDPCDVESAAFPAFADKYGAFDVVLFLGVLYHLENPLAAFRNLRTLVKPGGLLIVETHVDLLDVARPATAVYPATPGKPTWWGPNRAFVAGLLQANGFDAVRELPPDRPAPGRLAWHAR